MYMCVLGYVSKNHYADSIWISVCMCVCARARACACVCVFLDTQKVCLVPCSNHSVEACVCLTDGEYVSWIHNLSTCV